MDKDPTQKPQKTAYERLQESQATIDQLASTQPEVPIKYPEHYDPTYRRTYPSFTARGVELGDPDVRREGLTAFTEGTDVGGETHLILTGSRNGEPVRIILKRSFGSFDDYKDGKSQHVSAYESAFGDSKFDASDMRLSEDGQHLSFASEHARPGYEDFDDLQIDGMYLVPKIERERNYDQVKRTRFVRAFRAMTRRTKDMVLS